MIKESIVKDRAVAAGMGALTLAVHLAVWLIGENDPSHLEALVDSRTYHDLAVGLVRDGVFDERFLWQAPLYPLFLALVYKIFGVSMAAARVVQVALAAVTCVLTVGLGRRIGGRQVGWLSGLLVALAGPLVFFDLQLLASGLAAFWMVVLATLGLDALAGKPSSRRLLLLGAAGAAAVLTRPIFWPVLLAVGLWLLTRREGWGLRFRRSAWVLAGLALVLLPYTLAMTHLTDRSGLVPPSGGVNLFIGNNPEFEQTINIRVGLPWEALMAEPVANGYPPGPWAGQPYFQDRFQRFVTEQPGAWIRLLARKSAHLLGSRELPRNLDIYLHREWSPVLAALVFKIGAWGFPFGALLPLAVLGWASGRMRGAGLLAMMLASYGFALVLVFVSARYRVPLLPLLAIPAANGLLWIWEIVRGRRVRHGLKAAGWVLLILIPITVPGPFAQEREPLAGELHYGVGWNRYQREDWAGAEEAFRRAVDASPEMPEARNFLGLSLVKREAWQEAGIHFRQATLLAPDYSEARNNLKLCLEHWSRSRYEKARGLEAEKPVEALGLYEEIFADSPDWPEVRVRLAWMLATIEVDGLRDKGRASELLDHPTVERLGDHPYIREVKQAINP